MSPLRLFRYDPDIGYTFIPGLKLRVPHEFGGYRLATNALGFRDNRTSVREPARKRVLAFGDSFTAGDGVSNGDRFTDELERLLGEVEVLNFGLPGSGTDQQMIAYVKFARSLPCDVLMVAVLVENIRRITSHFRISSTESGKVAFQAKPYFELISGRLVRHNDPVPDWPLTEEELTASDKIDMGGRFPALRRLVSSLGLKEMVQQLTQYQPVPDYDDPQSLGWQLMRAILLEWRSRHHGAMLVVPIPLYQHVEQTASAIGYQLRFAELAAESEIVIHDVLPDLLRYSAGERRAFRFKSDVHLTPLGHRAIARSIAPVLDALLRDSSRLRWSP